MSYSVSNDIKTIDDIKRYFPEGQPDAMNWIVFSTSGVHGTYTTLTDIERYYEGTIEDEEFQPYLTVLVIQPRRAYMAYGHIYVKQEDIKFLRDLAYLSVEAIQLSQEENV